MMGVGVPLPGPGWGGARRAGVRSCGHEPDSLSLSASASRDSESTVNVNASSLNVKKLLFKSLLLLRC